MNALMPLLLLGLTASRQGRAIVEPSAVVANVSQPASSWNAFAPSANATRAAAAPSAKHDRWAVEMATRVGWVLQSMPGMHGRVGGLGDLELLSAICIAATAVGGALWVFSARRLPPPPHCEKPMMMSSYP